VRVKISYGADITEVPEEVDQLYTYVSAKSRSIVRQTEIIEEHLENEDLQGALFLIDKMRKTLARMDQRLSDLEMISVGYLTHIKGEEHVSDRRPAVDTSGIDDSITDTE
jgi:uncharacterized protein (UPF0305 family)